MGYRYRARDHYVVGREKIREFTRAVQDHHPVHWSEDAGADYGYGGLIAPLTFFSVPGFLAQAEMFASVTARAYDLRHAPGPFRTDRTCPVSESRTQVLDP